MKRPITPAYTFNPGAGTLDLSAIASFNIANLFGVLDIKTGAIVYAPAPGYGATVAAGILTLQAPMTGMSAGDPLMILYDDGGAVPVNVQASGLGLSIPTGQAPSLSSVPVVLAGTSSGVVVPPVTSGSAYAAGNVVGGLLNFAPVVDATTLSGILASTSLRSKSVQSVGFKLYLFRDNPTASTFNDKSAPSIAAADFDKLIDIIAFPAGDSGLGTHTIYSADGVGRGLSLASTSLYGVLVTTGAPTFNSTSDLSLLINVLRD